MPIGNKTTAEPKPQTAPAAEAPPTGPAPARKADLLAALPTTQVVIDDPKVDLQGMHLYVICPLQRKSLTLQEEQQATDFTRKWLLDAVQREAWAALPADTQAVQAKYRSQGDRLVQIAKELHGVEKRVEEANGKLDAAIRDGASGTPALHEAVEKL